MTINCTLTKLSSTNSIVPEDTPFIGNTNTLPMVGRSFLFNYLSSDKIPHQIRTSCITNVQLTSYGIIFNTLNSRYILSYTKE